MNKSRDKKFRGKKWDEHIVRLYYTRKFIDNENGSTLASNLKSLIQLVLSTIKVRIKVKCAILLCNITYPKSSFPTLVAAAFIHSK